MEYLIVLGIIFLGFIFITYQNNKNKDNPEYTRKFKVIDEDFDKSNLYSNSTSIDSIKLPPSDIYDSIR